MNRFLPLFLLVFASSSVYAGSPSLTIYARSRLARPSYSSEESNAGFAVVRDTVPLVLQQGNNDILAPLVSPMLDPASVILRDPTGKFDFRILLQKFRADALTEQSMLTRFEGQTIPFQVKEGDKVREVMGKIVRAGYWNRSGSSVDQTSAPIIEIEGRYMFTAPGTPIFPKLPEGEILKPELRWKIAAAKPGKVDAELIYMTDGLSLAGGLQRHHDGRREDVAVYWLDHARKRNRCSFRQQPFEACCRQCQTRPRRAKHNQS